MKSIAILSNSIFIQLF